MDDDIVYYPIVTYNKFYLPDDVEIIEFQDLNIPQVNEPTKPIMPKGPNDALITLSSIACWLCGCFGILVIFGGFFEESILLLFIASITGFVVYDLNKKFEVELDSYNRNMRIYEKELTIFQEYLSAKDSLTKINSVEENIREFSIRKYKDNITKITHPINTTARTGMMEAFFMNYVTSYFGKQERINDLEIVQNKGVHCLLPSDFPYTCDILLKHLATGILIDIEIDEPYVMDSKIPIHYVKEGKNGRLLHTQYDRDIELSEYHKWIIVRFAEEQIARYPELCCDFIYNVLGYMTKDERFNPKFMEIDDKFYIKAWTSEESINMGKSHHRLKYLEIANRKSPRPESENY